MPQIDTLWYDLEARTQDFDAGIARSKAGLADFTAYVKANPVAVLAGLTASFIAVGAAASKMAADLEYEMKKVQVITKGSSAELRALTDGVLELYKTTSVGSLDELTRGLQDIVGAGIEAGQSMEFLRVATEAAIGGATKVDVATSALLTLQANYAKTGLSVEQISDKMFRAVDVGRMSFEDLASTIGKVAPLTAQYDISLDDLLGTLAQLTVNGLSTAEAVTAIRSAIVNIINPTGKLVTEAPKLAAAFNADRLRKDGFAKFLVEFKAAAEDSGVEIQSLLGDVQGLIGALSLLGDGGTGAAEKVEALATSAGATKAAFDEMESSAKSLNQVMGNELRGTFTDLGESLLPWWNGVLLKVIETIDEKRAAIIRLRNAMLEIREIQGDALDAGQLSLARRKVDPSQGGTANMIGRSPLLGGIPGGSFARPAVLGLEAFLRNPNGFGAIDKQATALALLLAEVDKVGRAAFEGMSVPEMERLAGEMERLQRQLPKGTDADDVGALARNLRVTAEAAKAAADQSERLGKQFATAPAAAAAGKGKGKPETEAEKEREAREKKEAAAAERLKDRLAAAAKQVDALYAKAAATAKQFNDEQDSARVAATATSVDDLQLALARYTERAEEAAAADPLGFDKAAHDARLASFQKQIEAVRGLEAVQKQAAAAQALLDDMARRRSAAAADGTVFAPSTKDVAALSTWRAVMREIADDTRRTDGERALAAQALLQVEGEIAGVRQEEAKNKKKVVDENDKLVDQLTMIARGAISAADAFALMGDSAAKTSQDVVNMAEGVARLIKDWKDVGAWIQTIGSAINLAADAIGLGDALEEKKNRDANRNAVDRLQQFADALDTAIANLQSFSGNAVDGVARASQYLAEQTAAMQGGSRITNADATLRAFGATMEDAEAIAKAHGIEMDGTVDAFRRLNEALQETRAGFTEFGRGLADSTAYQELYFKAFKMERGPQDRVTDLLVSGSNASGDLGSQLLGAFSSGGIGGLREELQGLVEVLGPGGASLDPKLLGTMTPEQFRRYVNDLLDAIGAVEDELAPKVVSAAERLSASLAALRLSWDFDDVDDPSERLAQVTAAIAEMDPALSALTAGLDLASTDGLDEFGRRVADFAAQVEAGAVEIGGFTKDQLLEALAAWETGADTAAAAILAAADAQTAYTRSLEDDLRLRKLRALGMDGEADLAGLEMTHQKQLEEARQNNVTPELLAELLDVQKLEWVQALARQSEQAAAGADRTASRRGSGSVIATAGAQSVDLLIGIGNTELALHRAGNAYLAAIASALAVGPMPQLQPPLASAVYGSAGALGGGAGGGSAAGGIVVHQSVAFYGPVSGADEVRAGVRQGGSDVAAELQRRLDTQMRVDGRPEAR